MVTSTIPFSKAKAACPNGYNKLNGLLFQDIYRLWDFHLQPLDRDHYKLFSILTKGEFGELPKTLENDVLVEELTRWVVETTPEFKPVKSFTYNGNTIVVPLELGRISIGQNTMVARAIESTKWLQENICFASAVYLQPLLDNAKINAERIQYWQTIFEQTPVQDFYSVGFFLLTSVNEFGQRKTKSSSLTKIYRAMQIERLRQRLPKLAGSSPLVINH